MKNLMKMKKAIKAPPKEKKRKKNINTKINTNIKIKIQIIPINKNNLLMTIMNKIKINYVQFIKKKNYPKFHKKKSNSSKIKTL